MYEEVQKTTMTFSNDNYPIALRFIAKSAKAKMRLKPGALKNGAQSR